MMADSMYFVPWPGTSTAYIFNPWVKNVKLVRGYGYRDGGCTEHLDRPVLVTTLP